MDEKQETGSVMGLRAWDGAGRALLCALQEGRVLLCAVLAGGMALGEAAAKPAWEAEAAQARPWVYNWWMGNAVTKAGLEAQAKALAEGGFGGFHVIPIYGVKGNEANEPRYLSPEWRAKWAAAKRAAAWHGLGIDLTTGCGWCFGGRDVPLTNGGGAGPNPIPRHFLIAGGAEKG